MMMIGHLGKRGLRGRGGGGRRGSFEGARVDCGMRVRGTRVFCFFVFFFLVKKVKKVKVRFER